MAISKSFCLFFLIICASAFVGFSQGGGVGSFPCVQQLIPCQPYLKASAAGPPATCCVPLRRIVAQDSQCLCAVFNNPAILRGLNVTQQDGLNLVKACGVNADTSICQKGAATPTATPAPTSNSTATAPSPKKNAAPVISHAGQFLSLVVVISCSLVVFH